MSPEAQLLFNILAGGRIDENAINAVLAAAGTSPHRPQGLFIW